MLGINSSYTQQSAINTIYGIQYGISNRVYGKWEFDTCFFDTFSTLGPKNKRCMVSGNSVIWHFWWSRFEIRSPSVHITVIVCRVFFILLYILSIVHSILIVCRIQHHFRCLQICRSFQSVAVRNLHWKIFSQGHCFMKQASKRKNNDCNKVSGFFMCAKI